MIHKDFQKAIAGLSPFVLGQFKIRLTLEDFNTISGLVIYSSNPDWMTASAVQKTTSYLCFGRFCVVEPAYVPPSAIWKPAAPVFHMPLANTMTLGMAIVVVKA